ESTLIWAMSGAVLGDFISYLVGFHYKSRIHKVWPFTRYPEWLAKGERFFANHGGKSIIIGRFFGPARSMVPLIAGTLNMRPLRFLLFAIPSASAWAVGYMIPGIILGALSLELPPGLAIEFIVLALIVIAAFVLLTWLIRLGSKYFAKKIDKKTRVIWRFLQLKRKTHWITAILTDPYNPENHHQLILAVYAIICAILFVIIMVNVFTHGPLTIFNHSIYHLLRSLRSSICDNFFLAFTILGSKYSMLCFALLVTLWLVIRRYFRAAMHWLMVVSLSGGALVFFKELVFNARPGHLLNGPLNSSFPSGHTCLSMSLFGFLAILIAEELKPGKRRALYIVTACLIGLISFSRLYLGAHWLTDVAAGIFLGLAIVLVTTISYHRKRIAYIPPRKFLFAVCSILVLVWLLFGFYNFSSYRHNYTIDWPTHTISTQNWQQRTTDYIPLYRITRLGHTIEAFNVEWLGNLAEIKGSLKQQGWQDYEPDLTLKGILHRLASNADVYHLPLLPQIYQNQYPVLIMSKSEQQGMLILRLWHSNIKIKNSKQPFWIGIIGYWHPSHKLLLITLPHLVRALPGGTTEAFRPFLKDYNVKSVSYATDQQPATLQRLHWDGKILLIR
ncbi:MAG: phosphatase PAP2 family protein, partial [Gammaproteobacteria bacterium]|nr:phosphatase PAP2 family protein [Gammaproteobacteria bacterium]